MCSLEKLQPFELAVTWLEGICWGCKLAPFDCWVLHWSQFVTEAQPAFINPSQRKDRRPPGCRYVSSNQVRPPVPQVSCDPQRHRSCSGCRHPRCPNPVGSPSLRRGHGLRHNCVQHRGIRGAATILEQILRRPVIWIVCRHHTGELHIKHAYLACRGDVYKKGNHNKLYKRLRSASLPSVDSGLSRPVQQMGVASWSQWLEA